ncbi:phage/plasmid primase, P4 family [Clostridium chromiireducens]|uniref:phage/plasmid primase, P4 family n=1 Tax=Clostridium chromiireducens TaxID=225345 RepID=UPI0009A50565|nr:phage/plasmid primase, P4 family [Clostridium chromiireducens]
MNKEQKKIIIRKDLFPITPLINYSKKPIFRWSKDEYLIRNTDELENISKVYKREVDGEIRGGEVSGFSLVTGEKSGIIVIDIDKNHGDSSVDGFKSFTDFISDLSDNDKEIISDTFSVQTPRGGKHLYFKYKKGLKSKASYIDGVDIRTDGGLIVLPCSKVKIDNIISGYKVCNNNEILNMPQALFDKFMELDKPVKNRTAKVITLTTSDMYKEGARNQELFKEVISIVSKSSIRDISTIESIAKGLNLYKCDPPLDDKEVENIVGSISLRLHPAYCNEKSNVINYLLAQHIIQEQPCYQRGNLLFMYDNEKGFYKSMEFREVQKMYFKYAVNDEDKTPIKAKNFADSIMLISEDAKEVHDEKNYINCLNGVIDIENCKLLSHSPKYKLEVQFQGNYIEDWEESFDKSRFKVYLESTLDPESALTLQESWGLMLSPHTREVQNCFIYKGEGANGKSVAFDIQEALIGSNTHICSIGLGDFGGDFVISSAEGKHVNIVRDDELSGKTVNKFFKSMVCGEPVAVNRKNKDIIRLSFNTTMFFGLNRMPGASDKSTGFFRRPVIIPFNNSFGSEEEVKNGIRDKVRDPELAQRIIEDELDIVLMWSLEGLKRVKNNKWKVTVSGLADRELEEYRQEADSSYRFYREKLKNAPNSGIRLSKSDVYRAYDKWCILNNLSPMNVNNFGRQFSSFGVKSKVSNSVRYWVDVEFKN